MTQQVFTQPALVGPGKGIGRDRWGRPLIIPPDGGQPVPYTRCTTYVGALDDKEPLMKWKARMTAIGIANNQHLILKVKTATDGDKRTVNEAAEEAANWAGAQARAEIGTALHALTERIDRGEPVPDAGEFQPDIDAYKQVLETNHIRPVEIETFVVNDALKIGGTFDRVYEVNGVKYIGDLKTGSSMDFGVGKFAMQLAVYANSVRYSPDTGARTSLDVSRDFGIIIHLPAGEGRATVYWIDLVKGWNSVALASDVRRWRSMRAKEWIRPFHDEPQPQPQQEASGATKTRTQSADTLTAPNEYQAALPLSGTDTVMTVINTANTIPELEQAYWTYQASWTPQHTSAAAVKKHLLQQAQEQKQ